MFKTGTYTGDGAAAQPIVGVGFRPVAVFIFPQVDSVRGDATRSSADPANTFEWSFGLDYFYSVAGIASLDADGFTVNGINFNVNLRVYTYYCFGAACGWQTATGIYTGDGNATQAIVGVGFQPKLIFIIHRVPNGTNTPSVKTDQDGLNAYSWDSVVNQWRYTTDEIISLDAGGFTVGDGTPLARNDLNVLAQDYGYVAFRE